MSEFLEELKLVLKRECEKSTNIFIIGHNNPDFDSLGSALGLAYLIQNFNNNVFIIVDKIKDNSIKQIKEQFSSDFKIIDTCQFNKLRNDKSFVIMTDVNKREMISIDKFLDKIFNILVIDHHEVGKTTVKTNKLFIDTEASSSSEMVTRLIEAFNLKVPSEIANILMAGIVLDTGRYSRNVTSRTHDVAEKLYDMGANGSYVNSLFLDKFDTYKKIHNLMINETIIKKYRDELLPIQVSFSLNRERPKTIYKKEELAKVADNMMQFEFDAAIAIGYIAKDTVYISVRSKENINAAEVMAGIGGGDSRRAAGLIKSNDILEIEKQIMHIVNEAITRMKKEKLALLEMQPKTEETLILEFSQDSSLEQGKIKVLKNS